MPETLTPERIPEAELESLCRRLTSYVRFIEIGMGTQIIRDALMLARHVLALQQEAKQMDGLLGILLGAPQEAADA